MGQLITRLVIGAVGLLFIYVAVVDTNPETVLGFYPPVSAQALGFDVAKGLVVFLGVVLLRKAIRGK